MNLNDMLYYTQFSGDFFILSKNIPKFANADRSEEARSGHAGGSADIMGRVYSTLFLGLLKPGKLQSLSGMRQTVDALRI